MYTTLQDDLERRRSFFAARITAAYALALLVGSLLLAGWAVGYSGASTAPTSPEGLGLWLGVIGGAILAGLGLAAAAGWIAVRIWRSEARLVPRLGERSRDTLQRLVERERDRVETCRRWVLPILAVDLVLFLLPWLVIGGLTVEWALQGAGPVVLLAVTFGISVRRLRRLEATWAQLEATEAEGLKHAQN